MEKLIELVKNENIVVSSKIISYDNPDTIYIPIAKQASILIKKNEQIKIGTPLYKTNYYVETSPISGIISGLKAVNTIDGLKNALEIHNDFQEKKLIKSQVKINLNNLPKDKLTKLLELQFKINIKNNQDLVLNAIDDEPYVLTENFYLLTYYEEFLDILDKLAKIYNFKNITICVKSSSGENIHKLMECLGMYPNIKLKIVPNLYLLGKDIFLKKYLNLENDSLIIKASLLYDIYNLIKRNRQKTDKLIIITGDALTTPTIFKVRIGLKLEELLNNYLTITTKDVDFYVNGLMMGKKINIKDFVITEEVESIICMQKRPEEAPKPCINCGICTEICPVNLSPILLKNPTYAKKVQNKCLKCGLCSYICPTHINFNDYLKGGENE